MQARYLKGNGPKSKVKTPSAPLTPQSAPSYAPFFVGASVKCSRAPKNNFFMKPKKFFSGPALEHFPISAELWGRAYGGTAWGAGESGAALRVLRSKVCASRTVKAFESAPANNLKSMCRNPTATSSPARSGHRPPFDTEAGRLRSRPATPGNSRHRPSPPRPPPDPPLPPPPLPTVTTP